MERRPGGGERPPPTLWQSAQRERRITINLDQDIAAIFKAEALLGGPRYRVAINQALRAYLRDRELPERDRAVRTVLTALDDEAVIGRRASRVPGGIALSAVD